MRFKTDEERVRRACTGKGCMVNCYHKGEHAEEPMGTCKLKCQYDKDAVCAVAGKKVQ